MSSLDRRPLSQATCMPATITSRKPIHTGPTSPWTSFTSATWSINRLTTWSPSRRKADEQGLPYLPQRDSRTVNLTRSKRLLFQMTKSLTQRIGRSVGVILPFLEIWLLKSSQNNLSPPWFRIKLTVLSFRSSQFSLTKRPPHSKSLLKRSTRTSLWRKAKSLSLRTCPEPEESWRQSGSRRKSPSAHSTQRIFLSCRGPIECTSRPPEKSAKLFARSVPRSRATGRAPTHPIKKTTEFSALPHWLRPPSSPVVLADEFTITY